MNKISVAIDVAGEKHMEWIPLPQSELDVMNEEDWNHIFQPKSIDNILAEHVWKLLTWTQVHETTRFCFRFLKQGGRVRLAVLYIMHASAFIVDGIKPV